MIDSLTTTWDIVEKNPNFPWDWHALSLNPNISWTIVKSNMDKPWSYYYLSQNPSICLWSVIQSRPNMYWDWFYISCSPSITWEIIRDNPGISWDWNGVSMNPNITWEIVRENMDKPWNVFCLYSNLGFDLKAGKNRHNICCILLTILSGLFSGFFCFYPRRRKMEKRYIMKKLPIL